MSKVPGNFINWACTQIGRERFAKSLNTRRAHAGERFRAALVRLADQPQPVTQADILKEFGLTKNKPDEATKILNTAACIPGVSVAMVGVPDELHQSGKPALACRVSVDPYLRRFWDTCIPTSGARESAAQFYKRLRIEITARRKEANSRRTGRWTPDNIAKQDLHEILNWIEGELDHFLSGLSVDRRENADTTKVPSNGHGETLYGSENQV